jgi:hypothetical protein
MKIVVHGVKERGWFADNPENPHVAGAQGSRNIDQQVARAPKSIQPYMREAIERLPVNLHPILDMVDYNNGKATNFDKRTRRVNIGTVRILGHLGARERTRIILHEIGHAVIDAIQARSEDMPSFLPGRLWTNSEEFALGFAGTFLGEPNEDSDIYRKLGTIKL